MKLFEITADMMRINDLLAEWEATRIGEGYDAAETEVNQAVQLFLADLATAEAEKLDGYVYLIKTLEIEAQAAKAEADMFKAKQLARESRVRFLKGVMKGHLEKTGRASTKTARGYVIGVRKNGGKAPLHINEDLYSAYDEMIPEKLVKIRKEFDTDGIRAALETGEELPPGLAWLGEHGTHLRIT